MINKYYARHCLLLTVFALSHATIYDYYKLTIKNRRGFPITVHIQDNKSDYIKKDMYLSKNGTLKIIIPVDTSFPIKITIFSPEQEKIEIPKTFTMQISQEAFEKTGKKTIIFSTKTTQL